MDQIQNQQIFLLMVQHIMKTVKPVYQKLEKIYQIQKKYGEQKRT